MNAEQSYIPTPGSARMTYLMSTGANTAWLMQTIARECLRGEDGGEPDLGAMFDEHVHALVAGLHDGAECGEEYIVGLLYASMSLAMTAFGQLEADEAAWRLAHADSLDDLMGGADD